MAEQQKQKFPSEVVDLPSEGRLYPKEHPCSNGKIELKYMTAREEDILTSQNLIKKGIVIDKLLDSLILTEGVSTDDLLTGDKNAVMVAARILAYGKEYECDVLNPSTGDKFNYTFDLTECPFQKPPEEVTENKFELKLPISKSTVTFRVLNGKEESEIAQHLLQISKKVRPTVSPELTTRLKKSIISVDGDENQPTINAFVDNMLARDSMVLRKKINDVSPDISLKKEIDIEGETVEVAIPMTVNFFWPEAGR